MLSIVYQRNRSSTVYVKLKKKDSKDVDPPRRRGMVKSVYVYEIYLILLSYK
jgi:hypothetical protein